MKSETKIRLYVEAVRELDRLRNLTPTEEFAAERKATIKTAQQKVRDSYKLLTGGELGKAARILDGREREGSLVMRPLAGCAA